MANFVLSTPGWPPFVMDLGSHRDGHYLRSGFRAFISECPNCMERAAFILWECRSGFGLVTACAQPLDSKARSSGKFGLKAIGRRRCTRR